MCEPLLWLRHRLRMRLWLRTRLRMRAQLLRTGLRLRASLRLWLRLLREWPAVCGANVQLRLQELCANLPLHGSVQRLLSELRLWHLL